MRLLLAALLLTAATLKGHALWSQPFSSDFLLGSRTAELGVIYGETLLGFWLLSGWQWPLAWLTTLTIFTAFAARSGWQTWEGHSSCGCFGKVEVAPWLTLLIDLTAVALLFVVRPRASEWPQERRASARRVAIPLATAAMLLGGGFLFLTWQTGTALAALATLRGDFLTLTPALADLGTQPSGSRGEAQIEVRNHSAKPIRLVGGTSDCSCAATADLPVTIPPGGTATIRIQVKFSQQPGRFQRGYWLWTDAKEQPQAIAWFTGKVSGSLPPGGGGLGWGEEPRGNQMPLSKSVSLSQEVPMLVKAIDTTRQVLLGTALALLVASMFLIPQHRVLGDDGFEGDPIVGACPRPTCNNTCHGSTAPCTGFSCSTATGCSCKCKQVPGNLCECAVK